MIKTLKNTIKNLYYWIRKKLIRFKRWLVILILGAVVVAAPPLLPPNIPDIALEKIQAKYEASDIKDKYRLEKTAFILDAVDENAIQAEVGNKNLDEFVPELTLRKWDDEVNFKVKYKHGEKEKDQKVDIENKKIKWKGKKTEVHYYDIKKGELLHDKVLEHDVFEVEVILLEKPNTNIVEFDIETKGLSFYYQPELTQQEKDDGAIRPENVIGSYAVYHESKTNHILYPFKKGELTLDELNQKVLSNELIAKIDKKTLDIEYFTPGKNYRAGKAFHIYSPKIIDNAGTEVWGELNITDNLLTVEIPQEFLDNAVYPVRHAAGLTFGHYNGGTPGGSRSYSMGDGYCGKFVCPESGTGSSMSCYIAAWSGSYLGGYAMGLYDYADGSAANIVSGGDTAYGTTSATPGWHTQDFSGSPAVSATDYTLLFTWEKYTYRYYDSGGTAAHSPSVWDSSPLQTTVVANYSSGNKYSIYVTYTAGGGAERRMFLIE